MPRKKRNLCAICGERPATTRDHIPPAGIFIKPRPNDLISVPSCFQCNNGASDLDERFRVYLTLHVAGESPRGIEMFFQNVEPTIAHNRRLRRAIINELATVDVTTPAGIYAGKEHIFHWDSDCHDRVIERMIRGLHFHHTGVILGASASVKIQYLQALAPKIAGMFRPSQTYAIGGDQFMYKFIFSPLYPLYSVWLFQFHGRKWSSGYAVPIASDR